MSHFIVIIGDTCSVTVYHHIQIIVDFELYESVNYSSDKRVLLDPGWACQIMKTTNAIAKI